MIELDIRGIGCWSECFADWADLERGLRSGAWAKEVQLAPEMIAPRERRRAPHTVKMAVEALGQACNMAGEDPSDVVVVFSSAMGDMTITDWMCSTLAKQPELVSPTQFHNSVHNAAIGYWSIATGSHAPATAVAGHDHSAALGLLESAIQCTEDRVPVLFVCQEGAAPHALKLVRNSLHPLTLALLFGPQKSKKAPLAGLKLEVEHAQSSSPKLPASLPLDFSDNPAAALLPLFAALAGGDDGKARAEGDVCLPLNANSSLRAVIERVDGR